MLSSQGVMRQFVRGKKTSTATIYTQRIVNQLSALSASRKQPKLLSLSKEDLVKHKTIMNAWALYQRNVKRQTSAKLEKQHESIKNAMEDLKVNEPELFAKANEKQTDKLFPLEMRVPTDFPAKQPWVYNFTPKE